jgi:hypothetical protein
MRNYVMLLALGVVTSACGGAGSSNVTGPSSGPSLTRGAMVVSTATSGNVPNQDGYLLVLDTTPFFGLKWNGTARLAVPTGHHTLRLRRVPQNCSVLPDTVLDVVVALGDTITVDFATTCPPVPRGYARITLLTTGSPSTPAPYDVWYEHYDEYNGDQGGFGKLGELSPGGTVLVRFPASTDTGDDPYFYQFWIYPVPSNCGADTYTSQYNIKAQDTVDVAVTVACTP